MKISSSMPYFDIKTTNARIDIQFEPLRLKVEREPAKMRVHHTRPKMKVNWKKVQAQCGLRSPAAQRRHTQPVSYTHLAEYSKDVSAMLRRDDNNNEFADRMNKMTARQEAKTVAQSEKAAHARVRGDQERLSLIHI